MALIALDNNLPGISGLLRQFPDTGLPLRQLAQAILFREDLSLPHFDRELIAAFVSKGNGCEFCMNSHAAAAASINGSGALVAQMLHDPESAPLSEKQKALLAIAELVRSSVKNVTLAAVERAQVAGADDRAIHDTVLIAAAFCMFNRYVDALATSIPENPEAYPPMGQGMAVHGYLPPATSVNSTARELATTDGCQAASAKTGFFEK